MEDRRGDWSHGVDENLASLNAGQRVWEKDIETVHEMLSEIDHLLRGNTEEGTSGLVARLESVEHELAKLSAVIFIDSTGRKGLLHEVESLLKHERTLGERWKFATAIVVAVLSFVGLLITNWEKVGKAFGYPPKQTRLEKIIKKSRQNRTHHYIIREIQKTDDAQPETEQPN